jgi:hypothetical protein
MSLRFGHQALYGSNFYFILILNFLQDVYIMIKPLSIKCIYFPISLEDGFHMQAVLLFDKPVSKISEAKQFMSNCSLDSAKVFRLRF